ncbi:MAG: endonuclease III [Acidobacteria bacterium]|nr:endonuclease III [Acidobacteriota bacterium]
MARPKAMGKIPEKVQRVLRGLEEAYPEAICALNFSNPLQLLVATILSAQCTDERVNQVTRRLFRKYKTAQDYADADLEDLQKEIRSTGFFRNKQKSIQGAAAMLVEKFQGKVPRAMESLLQLPGVARKTANVVLGTAYGIAEGVVVDTHVRRVTQRLGLTEHDDPERIERDLMRQIPRERWISFSHQLIWHGRRICQARKPLCAQCNLTAVCDYYQRVVHAV